MCTALSRPTAVHARGRFKSSFAVRTASRIVSSVFRSGAVQAKGSLIRAETVSVHGFFDPGGRAGGVHLSFRSHGASTYPPLQSRFGAAMIAGAGFGRLFFLEPGCGSWVVDSSPFVLAFPVRCRCKHLYFVSHVRIVRRSVGAFLLLLLFFLPIRWRWFGCVSSAPVRVPFPSFLRSLPLPPPLLPTRSSTPWACLDARGWVGEVGLEKLGSRGWVGLDIPPQPRVGGLDLSLPLHPFSSTKQGSFPPTHHVGVGTNPPFTPQPEGQPEPGRNPSHRPRRRHRDPLRHTGRIQGNRTGIGGTYVCLVATTPVHHDDAVGACTTRRFVPSVRSEAWIENHEDPCQRRSRGCALGTHDLGRREDGAGTGTRSHLRTSRRGQEQNATTSRRRSRRQNEGEEKKRTVPCGRNTNHPDGKTTDHAKTRETT